MNELKRNNTFFWKFNNFNFSDFSIFLETGEKNCHFNFTKIYEKFGVNENRILWISIDDKLTLIYKLYFIIFYNIKNKLCITYMYSA